MPTLPAFLSTNRTQLSGAISWGVIAVCLVLAACGDNRTVGSVSTGNTARIVGSVRDTANRPAVADVKLLRVGPDSTFPIKSAASQIDGSFRFDSLEPGTYAIRVDKDGQSGGMVEAFELAEAQEKIVSVVINIYIVNNINITINNYTIQNIYLNSPDNVLSTSGTQAELRAVPESGQIIYVKARDSLGIERTIRVRLDYVDGKPVFTQLDSTGVEAEIDTVAAPAACEPMTSTGSTSHFALDDGTVALWRFNEGCGDVAYDASSGNHDLDLAGSTWTTGAKGASLRLAGASALAQAAGRSNGQGGGASVLALEAVIQLDGAAPAGVVQPVVGKATPPEASDAAYLLEITADDRPKATFDIGGVRVVAEGRNALPHGRWVRVAAQWDGSRLGIWIDGALDTIVSGATGVIRGSLAPLVVGGLGTGTGRVPVRGLIDEIRISNVARYRVQTTFFPLDDATVALWTFDTLVGGKMPDLSANRLDLGATGSVSLVASPEGKAFLGAATGATPERANSSMLTLGPTGQIVYQARIRLGRYPIGTEAFMIMGLYEGLKINVRAGGRFQATVQFGDGSSWSWYAPSSAAGTIPLDTWVTVTAAADQGTNDVHAWIDGVPVPLVSTVDRAGPQIRVSTGTFVVGNDASNPMPFIGEIDEIRVANAIPATWPRIATTTGPMP